MYGLWDLYFVELIEILRRNRCTLLHVVIDDQYWIRLLLLSQHLLHKMVLLCRNSVLWRLIVAKDNALGMDFSVEGF